MKTNFINQARKDAQNRAKLWTFSDFVILDTETTGLYDADAIEIAAIDYQGQILLNTRVQTDKDIHPKAQAVHGISKKDLEDAPDFSAVYGKLADAVRGKLLLIYNKGYDLPILDAMSEAIGKPPISSLIARSECVMECYAEFTGEWNDYHGSFRWQRLEGGDHSALGDCLATLETVKRMAGE